ncbi:MAG: molybdopterin-dependent oxidoreductase [Desulfobacter sp.]|nr:MAG: molybdopterin-dependent oxidoreductase [Desulfobacter sp.]
MKYVNQAVPKRDAMALVTGKPVYTDDIAPENCLIVKILRSPHAFAKIKEIRREKARALPGVACVLTHEDVPDKRFTMAGQSIPEPSPYDRRILDTWVRHVGDPVAIVAARTEKQALAALKAIEVDYEVLEPVLDPETADGHASLIHPEANYHVNFNIGNDVKNNICSSGEFSHGDVDAAFDAAEVVVDQTYRTCANNQAMMETFRAFTHLDHTGRLVITASTQVPFHVRAIAARALDIPRQNVRVIKPRIGGGFGAKQTLVAELFPAIVTLKTGKPAKMVFTRQECFTAATSRHAMTIRVRLGADKTGNILGIHMDTLSDTGAYGEHGPTTVGLSGHKTMPLYNKARAIKFTYKVVYTNTMSAGAYRGYGATQGTFAMESAMDELAKKLAMDPMDLRLKNLVKEGEIMPGYYGEKLNACTLDQCIAHGKDLIGWADKFPCKKISDTKIRAVGGAITMQGSSIANIDTASVEIRLQDDGFYTLMIGAADMGTGCDTILSQMAAEVLNCDLSRIIVAQVDTDHSPYDTGSYASATTYLTGMSVVKAGQDLIRQLMEAAALKFELDAGDLEFDGNTVFAGKPGQGPAITLDELAADLAVGEGTCLSASATSSSPVSPPPFMAGFAEIELDTETGQVSVVDYVGVVDCGTPINTNLARMQTEGGIVQGIGMALTEEITYNSSGKMMNSSFMQYKIPSRLDMGSLRVEFKPSHEPTGPFGAKSIGEVVINTPAPAIANAIENACGLRLRTLPMTAETICRGIHGF